MTVINIEGLDRALVLKALWESAKVVFPNSPPLDLIKAVELCSNSDNENLAFGTVNGRKIDMTLKADVVDETAYDAHTYAGCAAKAVAAARAHLVGLSETTAKINAKIFKAFDDWKTKYNLEPMQSGIIFATIANVGPNRLQDFIKTAVALSSVYAHTSLQLSGAELEAFADRQTDMAQVYVDAVMLMQDILPMVIETGGALIMPGFAKVAFASPPAA